MRNLTFLLFFLLISFCCSTIKAQDAYEPDSLALVAIYEAGDGENWDWLEDRDGIPWFTGPVKDWKYLAINENGRVTHLGLNQMNMGGYLSPAIGDLTELVQFEIQGWENERIYVDVAGELPAELWNCSKLTRIQFKFTRMSGEIPTGIENLQVLNELNTQATKFSGSIPAELFNLPNISKLYLHQSAFEGAVPSTLANATNLTRFYIHENKLTELPFVALDNPSAAKIELAGNFFSFADVKAYHDAHETTPYGALNNTYQYAKPLDYQEVVKGSPFGLDGTVDDAEGYAWFFGDVATPFAFESTTDVVLNELADEGVYTCKAQSSMAPGCEIRTQYNLKMDISGAERDLLALTAIYEAADGENWIWHDGDGIPWFTGPVEEWKYLTVNEEGRVNSLGLNQMNIGGVLSPAIGQLTELNRLEINGSESERTYVDISGELPAELWNCTKLTRIQFKFTRMSGEIPAGIENLQVLDELNTQATKFSGSIPAEIFNLPNISKLYLHQSAFEGAVPSTLANATNLTRFYIHENKLTELPFVALDNPSAAKIELAGNFFSFADVKAYHDAHETTPYGALNNTYQYAQEPKDVSVKIGDEVTLEFDDEVADAEMFAWFKDNQEAPVSTDDKYTIASVTEEDQGTYVCKIQSSLVANFELRGIFNFNGGTIVPNFVNAYSLEDGKNLVLTFDYDLANPSGQEDAFFLTVDGVEVAVNSVKISNDNLSWLILTLETAVSNGEAVIALTYTPGNVQGISGGAVVAFGPVNVVNNYVETSIDLGKVVSQVNAYPNPVVNTLLVNSDNMINKLSVYDSYGRVIKLFDNVNSYEKIVEFDSLGKGIYLIRVESIEGIINTLKVIKN